MQEQRKIELQKLAKYLFSSVIPRYMTVVDDVESAQYFGMMVKWYLAKAENEHLKDVFNKKMALILTAYKPQIMQMVLAHAMGATPPPLTSDPTPELEF